MNDEIKATDVSGARSVREVLATPVGDLVWPGRSNAARAGKRTAEAIIGESALPTGVKDHILEIVRRTRLRRREQADVARELESHFREGVAAGAPPERMLVEFGSARTTARLIRRAKLRCRGWLWHAKVRTLQSAAVCVGVLACVYGYGAARFYGLEANIARNYVAEWNAAALATPEHERGWPKYADGLVALSSGSDMWTRKWPVGENELDWTQQTPGSAGWSDVCAWLESRAPAVATLREAALAERMGYVASATWDEHLDRVLEARNPGANSERLEKSDPNPSLISVLLPQLGEIRSVARVLRLDAQRATEEGDAATAVADILALTRVATHARECPTLISELVSVAVSGLACDTVLNVVAARPHLFTAEHLREMAHGIAGMRGGVMHVSIEGERAMFDDVLQRCFSDDGNGDGVLVASAKSFLIPSLDVGEVTTGNAGEFSFTGPALSLVMAGRREQSEFYERTVNMAIAESTRPAWTRDWEKLERLGSPETYGMVSRARYWPAWLLVPAFGRAFAAGDHAAVLRDATLVVLAAHAYAADNGRMPRSMEEMTPRYLSETKVDRHDGKALRYAVRDGKPLVYSVGCNRRDDEGVQKHGPTGNAIAARFGVLDEKRRGPKPEVTMEESGDWVIFPPVTDE